MSASNNFRRHLHISIHKYPAKYNLHQPRALSFPTGLIPSRREFIFNINISAMHEHLISKHINNLEQIIIFCR